MLNQAVCELTLKQAMKSSTLHQRLILMQVEIIRRESHKHDKKAFMSTAPKETFPKVTHIIVCCHLAVETTLPSRQSWLLLIQNGNKFITEFIFEFKKSICIKNSNPKEDFFRILGQFLQSVIRQLTV